MSRTGPRNRSRPRSPTTITENRHERDGSHLFQAAALLAGGITVFCMAATICSDCSRLDELESGLQIQHPVDVSR
jgi:hypothetical protein